MIKHKSDPNGIDPDIYYFVCPHECDNYVSPQNEDVTVVIEAEAFHIDDCHEE